MPETSFPHRRRLIGAVAAAAILAFAGGVAFYYAVQQNTARNAGQVADATVTIDAKSCQPNAITVPGGRRSFEIVNVSDRPIEWEILDGVMVLAERENIAPGFRATLTAQLAPGSYAMACGLLSNPRGTLTVTESDEASAAASEVTLRKFLGPLSEYRVYLVMQSREAVATAQTLQAAIAAGDLDAAREAWIAARLPYRRIEPLAYRISDLENAIDPRAAYLAGREADPGFTGYHRIEYGLFGQNSTDGLLPVADRLVADLTTLGDRLKSMPVDPQLLAALPGDMAGQLVHSGVPDGENAYAGTDLQEFHASFEGIDKLTGLLRSVLAGVDPALDAQIGQDLAATGAALEGLKTGETWPEYAQIGPEARKALADDLTRLQTALVQAQGILGVN